MLPDSCHMWLLCSCCLVAAAPVFFYLLENGPKPWTVDMKRKLNRLSTEEMIIEFLSAVSKKITFRNQPHLSVFVFLGLPLGRPGYFYWETVLFQTTILKWDYFSKFSDYFCYYHFSYKITWQVDYIHMYVWYIQLVSFQTLHTKKIWENKTYFH